MNIQEMAGAFGIPLHPRRPKPSTWTHPEDHARWTDLRPRVQLAWDGIDEIGDPPSRLAELREDGQIWYDETRPWLELCEPVLHELVHAISPGGCITVDEGPMLPLQWELMKLLSPDEFVVCRAEFTLYGFSWEDAKFFGSTIGGTDAFAHSEAWHEEVRQALLLDLLHRDRQGVLHPVWTLGAS